jgi:hypothetical protein
MILAPVPLPPEAIVEICEVVFSLIAAVALGIPIIRIIGRRFERPAFSPPNTQSAPADVTARLERIEQAVEAVAIEVERIAEGQRFSARLLAEQAQRSLSPPDGGQ